MLGPASVRMCPRDRWESGWAVRLTQGVAASVMSVARSVRQRFADGLVLQLMPSSPSRCFKLSLRYLSALFGMLQKRIVEPTLRRPLIGEVNQVCGGPLPTPSGPWDKGNMSNDKVDFNDPMVRHLLDSYQRSMAIALNAPQQVESAVRPIYWPFKQGKKAQQGGTGVVVRIGDEHFVFSASHVFDDIRNYVLLLGAGNGELLATLSGDRFSTPRGPSGTHEDDLVDASVFHIQSGLTEAIEQCAITLKDFDLEGRDRFRSAHLVIGFKVNRSYVDGDHGHTRREAIPTVELSDEDYAKLGIDPKMNIALAYENKGYVDGRFQDAPGLKGLSGGAIVRVDGVSLMAPIFPAAGVVTQRLAAITIARRKEKLGKPGAIVGTRIGVHLGLIENYLPGLLPKFVG